MFRLDPDLDSSFGGFRYFDATSAFARIDYGLITWASSSGVKEYAADCITFFPPENFDFSWAGESKF